MIAICSRGDWLTRVKGHGRATKCVWNIETERFHLQGFEKRISVTAFADTSFHFSEQKKKSLDKKSVLCEAVIVNFSSIRYLFFKSFSLTVYESAKWQIFVSPSRLLRNLEQKKNEACLFLNEGKKKKKKLFCHNKKGAKVVQFNCVLNTSSPQ